MNKRKQILIGISVLILGGLVFSKPIFSTYRNTDTIANKIGCRLFEFNNIIVEVNNGLELSDIEINSGDRTIFTKGKQVNKVGQGYGHTIFSVYHKELLIAEIGHWKRNNWYTNDYNISISLDSNGLVARHTINGPDGKNDNFQKKYIYNEETNLVRIDYLTENGEIYNSELKIDNKKEN